MNTANPSKRSILFNAAFLVLCLFTFVRGAMALFGVIPGGMHSLTELIIPILMGAGFLSRLWLAWRGERAPLPLLAIPSIAAGGLGFLLWRLSGQPFARYDMVYLLLLPLPFVMIGIVRFNEKNTPSEDELTDTH